MQWTEEKNQANPNDMAILTFIHKINSIEPKLSTTNVEPQSQEIAR